MKIYVDENSKMTAVRAAGIIAERICDFIEKQGECRILLSTGASQFDVLSELVKKDVDWNRVIMFHLDEYVNLPITHGASFRKYLTERFIEKTHPCAYHFVNGEGDVQANIAALTKEIRKAPIDVALVGIGENGHIAFNDPPADFETKDAYLVVNLDDRCKQQQMGEGWFATIDDVPDQAISMSPYQIMQSRVIYSIVNGSRKARAIRDTLEAPETTPMVPATLLREHDDCTLFLDVASAAETKPEFLA